MEQFFDSAKIARALATLDQHDYGDVLQCMRCGTCLPTCPTYRTDGIETQSPRGRVAMIKAVIDGRLSATEEFVAHMYHCLDCRHCQSVCPAGVKPGELILEARHRIEENMPQPLIKRFLLHWAVRNQKRLSIGLTPLRWYQSLGIKRLIRNTGLLSWMSADLEFMDALLPPLSSRPLSESLPVETPAQGPVRGRVGFFLGCAMNLLFPEVSRDTIELLSRAGFAVVVPRGQGCCGAPNIEEGEREVYRDLAAKNLRLFADASLVAVVTDCAACGAELKSYGAMLAGRPMEGPAREFSALVRDVSEFLSQNLGPEKVFGSLPGVVTFHDPCHLRHAQGVTRPPRELLDRVPSLEYRELPDDGQCCGSAGIYNVTHRERSLKVLEAKITAIQRSGAELVVTSNPGCLLQLEYGRKRWKQPWRLAHLSQVLRRSWDRGRPGWSGRGADISS